jgi:hypothetical protein
MGPQARLKFRESPKPDAARHMRAYFVAPHRERRAV